MSAKNILDRLKPKNRPSGEFSSPKSGSPNSKFETSPSTHGSLNLDFSFEQPSSPAPITGIDDFFLPAAKIEQQSSQFDPFAPTLDTLLSPPTSPVNALLASSKKFSFNSPSFPGLTSPAPSTPSAAAPVTSIPPLPADFDPFAQPTLPSPLPSPLSPSSPLAPKYPLLSAIIAADYPKPLSPGTSDPFDPFSDLTPTVTLADSYSNPPSPQPTSTAGSGGVGSPTETSNDLSAIWDASSSTQSNELADLLGQTSLGGASQIPDPSSPQRLEPPRVSMPIPPFVRETNVKNNSSDDTIRIMGFLSTGIAFSGLPCVMSFPEVLGVTESRRFVVTYSSSLCSAIRRASRSLDRILVDGDMGYPTPFSVQLKPFLALLPKATYSIIYSKESGQFNYIPFDNNNKVQAYTPRGGLCFLGTKSPEEVDKERVEWFRERIREGKRPPILTFSETEKWLQWGSGMDHFIIDGHCRIAAYMAEDISPPILDIRTSRNRDKNLWKEDLLFFNDSTALYRDKATALQQRYMEILSQDTERHGFDENGDDKCVIS